MLYEDLSYQCDLSDRVSGGRKELEKLMNFQSNKPLAKDNLLVGYYDLCD